MTRFNEKRSQICSWLFVLFGFCSAVSFVVMSIGGVMSAKVMDCVPACSDPSLVSIKAAKSHAPVIKQRPKLASPELMKLR